MKCETCINNGSKPHSAEWQDCQTCGSNNKSNYVHAKKTARTIEQMTLNALKSAIDKSREINFQDTQIEVDLLVTYVHDRQISEAVAFISDLGFTVNYYRTYTSGEYQIIARA